MYSLQVSVVMVNPGGRQPDIGHFCQVGTFATQEISHFGIAFSFAVSEQVNAFNIAHLSSIILVYLLFLALSCQFIARADFVNKLVDCEGKLIILRPLCLWRAPQVAEETDW